MKFGVFSKQDTQIGKGIAILWMLFHHLFAFDNRVAFPYVALLPRAPIDFLSALSQFGSICVSLFVILSGIGIYKVSQKTKLTTWRISHIKITLFRYILLFFISVPIGFLFFEKTFRAKEFLANLFLLSNSYNQEWWFLRIYLEILLFSPLLLHMIKKSPRRSAFFSLCLSLIGLLLRREPFSSFFLIKEVSNLFLWQLLFVIGCLLAAFDIYERVDTFIKRKHLDHWWCYLLPIILCILIRQYPLLPAKVKDPLLAPLFLYCSIHLVKTLHLSRLFALFGRHSMNMWLLHTFFCYYYLQWLVFLPMYSLLIFIWLVVLSFVTSCLLHFIETYLLTKFRLKNDFT